MADTLVAALTASASGLSAQSQRLRVVSENLANAMATLIRLPSSQRGGSRRIG